MKYVYITLLLSLTLGAAFPISLFGRQYNIQYAEITLIITLLVLLVWYLYNKLTIYHDDMIPLAWFFLIVWTAISYIWAQDDIQHLGGLIAFFDGFIAYIVSINLLKISPNSFRTAQRLFTLSLVLQLAMNLLTALTITNYGYSFYGMKAYAVTAMGKSNYIAIYLGFALLYEFSKKTKDSLFWGILAGMGLIMTLSRAGLLASGMAICFAIFMEIRKPYLRKIVYTFCFLGVVIIFIFLTPFGNTLTQAMTNLPAASSWLARQRLWSDAWGEFIIAPITGHGLQWKGDPHNIFLRALRDLGILGAVLCYAILLIPLVNLIRSKKIKRLKFLKDFDVSEVSALFFAYLAILIHSFVEPFFFTSSSQIWLGATLAYITTIKKSHYYKVKSYYQLISMNLLTLS